MMLSKKSNRRENFRSRAVMGGLFKVAKSFGKVGSLYLLSLTIVNSQLTINALRKIHHHSHNHFHPFHLQHIF